MPAPELNIFWENNRRFYRVRVQGQVKRGRIVNGTGQLELKGTLLANSNAPAFPKLTDVDWAKLMLTLQTSNYLWTSCRSC